MFIHLLLDSKYDGEKMDFEQQAIGYEGLLLKVPTSNIGILESVEGRASRFGKILSETPFEEYVNVLVSMNGQYEKEFLDPFKRLEIPYYKLGKTKTPNYIV